MIATAFIPRHVADSLSLAIGAAEAPWTVITHRICPQVTKRGALAAGDLVDISTIAPVDRHLPVCIADQPEQLAMAMLSIGLTPLTEQRPRLAPL